MRELKGKLDLSGCTKLEYLCFRDNFITELDVSGCTSLSSLICYRNCLTSLNVSDCCQLSVLAFQENSVSTIDISHNPLLTAFCCDGNEIDSLDLSHNHELSELRCENNHITSLDLSNNPKLAWLWTDGNPLSKLDLSSNPQLCINKISSVGGGTACYNGNEYANSVTATSVGDIEFIGWFDAKDEVVSRDAEYIMSAGSPKELTAKFGAPMRGSVDEEDLSYVQERYSNYLLPIILSVTVVILAAVGAVTYKRLRSR